MTARRAVIVLGAAGVLSGCAGFAETAPERVLPTPPADFAAADAPAAAEAARPAVDFDWVESFGDPLLVDLVDEALARNTDVLTAAARLRAAAEQARVRDADLWPTLDAGLDSTTRMADGRAGSTSLGLGLDLRWEADIWGRLSARAGAAGADAAASAADLAALRLSIAGRTATAWFDLLEAQLQTDLARRDLATQERSLMLVQRRYNRGVARAVDLRLARSAVASREATLAQRRQRKAELARALEILVSRYPAGTVNATADLPVLDAPPPVASPAQILPRRPDVAAAERRLDAAGLRAEEARKALLPRLTLTASGGTDGPDFADLVDPERLAATLLGSLAQPVFRAGALRADARAAEARAEAALGDYAGAVLDAWREVEDGYAAETFLAAREAALAVAAEEADAAETLTERQYANGLATIFELLDAQTRRINAESQLIAARAARVRNRALLYVATGSGLERYGLPPGGLPADTDFEPARAGRDAQASMGDQT
jgi:NodT family efflux transporter outer membrane factor (OMF) lipoprotein